MPRAGHASRLGARPPSGLGRRTRVGGAAAALRSRRDEIFTGTTHRRFHPHVPPLQVPEQQRLPAAHTEPADAHWHMPAEQLPEQQSVGLTHAAPATTHAHEPAVHVAEQHSSLEPQATPAVEQAQVPVPGLHEPEQQSASSPQTAPVVAQVQAPLRQAPEQHSSSCAHADGLGAHAHPLSPDEAPEQQVVAPEPGRPQQTPVPPQTRPGSHCAVTWHAIPSDGAHW
jgi:hypothetical protein